METIVLWVTCCCIITAFLDFDEVDNMGFLYLFMTLPIVIPGFLQQYRIKRKYIYTTIMKHIKNDIEAECFLIELYELIENRINN